MDRLQPLQRLTFAQPPAQVSLAAGAGELKWLKLTALFVDPAYQRHIIETGKKNIRTMMEEFTWAKFGVCVVARRGANRYAIIDGQHRCTAAFNRGDILEVPCLVLAGSVADEARSFAAINGNVTRIHALQSFRAAVAGGDAESVAIAAACAEAGVTIAPYPKTTDLKAGETCALAAIRKCYRRHGKEALTTALIVLRAADPQAPLTGTAVAALCETAPKHPEWNADAAHIGGCIAKSGKTLMRIEADAHARRQVRGGALWSNFAALIENLIAAGARATTAPLSRLMAGR